MLKTPLFNRVVVAYNGSEHSLHAVMYAIILAKQYKYKVKVVFVADTSSIRQLSLAKFLIGSECEEMEGSLQEDGQKNLEMVAKMAKSKGVIIETELRTGAVWSEIITAADEFKASTILLGGKIRSFGNLEKDAVSRQNNEIIGSAHCSVMVVREPYIEQYFKLV